MSETLVLNSGFIPIRIISDKEAVCLLYQNKCYTVVETDKVMRSPSVTFKVPSVIALLYYGDTPRKKVTFSKLNVIYRDDQKCMYCGKRFSIKDLTVDHVIPRSRWAKEKHTSKKNFSNFLNCVSACHWCNNAKGNHLIEELGWKLLRKPYEPEYLPHIVVSYNKAKSRGWLPFAGFNIRLVDMVEER